MLCFYWGDFHALSCLYQLFPIWGRCLGQVHQPVFQLRIANGLASLQNRQVGMEQGKIVETSILGTLLHVWSRSVLDSLCAALVETAQEWEGACRLCSLIGEKQRTIPPWNKKRSLLLINCTLFIYGKILRSKTQLATPCKWFFLRNWKMIVGGWIYV